MNFFIEKFHGKYKQHKYQVHNLVIFIFILIFLFCLYYIFEISEVITYNKSNIFSIYKRLLYIPIVIAAWRFRFKYSLLITTMIGLWEIISILYFEKSVLMIHSLIISFPMYYFVSAVVGLLKLKNIRLNEVYNQFEQNCQETVDAMIKVLEAKDLYTKGHSERVSNLTSLLVDKMHIPPQEAEDIRTAARLHDIGKIGIGDSILNKPERLTDEEYAVIKNHPVIGAEVLGKIKELDRIIPIIYHHHERYDGKGYPDGLKGDEIPLGSRIISVVDSFDAMISKRAYREPYSLPKAVNELIENIDKQFEGQIVYAFLEVSKDIGLEC